MMITVDRADETALRELYDAHAGALLAYAMRLTGGDRGRAEDVVQETLLRAWRHRDVARRVPRPDPAVAVHRGAPRRDRRLPGPRGASDRGRGRRARVDAERG